MIKPTNCKHCKKPIDAHTIDELAKCKIEIAKKEQPNLSEDDAINYFTSAKTGEPSRMGGAQRRQNKVNKNL